MKTTLELPDELLIEAKMAAARRRTTLKAIVEHALRREIRPTETSPDLKDGPYEMDDLGFLRLKKRGVAITTETISKLQQEIDDEDFGYAMELAGKR